MSVFWLRRRAGKQHACDWGCQVPIKVGEQYQEVSVTPGDSEFGKGSWIRYHYHGGNFTSCPIDWRFHPNTMVRALGAFYENETIYSTPTKWNR